MCSIVVYTDYKRPQFSVVRDSLACCLAVVSCDEPLLWQKKKHMNLLELSKQSNVLQQ